MQGNARRESRLSPHLRCVAGLAFALFALDAATPALAAVAKPTAAASKPPAVAAEKWEGYWAKEPEGMSLWRQPGFEDHD